MLLGFLLWLLAVPAALCSGYLGLLAFAGKRKAAPAPSSDPRTRFVVLVPAHQEQARIASTITGLLLVDYPRELFEVFVVAENCKDATRENAVQAGAQVIDYFDPTRPGRGPALAHAFDQLLARANVPDAIFVVDPDAVVSPNVLRVLGAHLEQGARAIQIDFDLRNPGSSWGTRMKRLALAAFHRLPSIAREQLGLSVGLPGDGMAFAVETLREARYQGTAGDNAYAIELARKHRRVAYAHEACVLGDLGPTRSAPRRRWRSNGLSLGAQAIPALREAWAARKDRARSLMLLDLAVDLVVPPLWALAPAVFLGTLVSVVFSPWSLAWLPWGASLGALVFYAVRSFSLENTEG
ncbi:MAG TPA: glycosyltransferase family 2 protein [Polyangiaceae bacterium]|nr:glycosyltransferase family 2 protein [Polyangiaceae bacterium]